MNDAISYSLSKYLHTKLSFHEKDDTQFAPKCYTNGGSISGDTD